MTVVPVTAVLGRVGELATIADKVARTEYAQAMRGKPEAVFAAMLAGAELGLPPMTSLRSISIIDGKPNLSAEVMRALVLNAGHELQILETSAERAVVVGRRAGSEQWSAQFVWDIPRAQAAQLTGKDNWKRYPAAMLLARASTDLCRAVFPDVIAGLVAEEEVRDYDAEPPKHRQAQRRVSPPALEVGSGVVDVDEVAPAELPDRVDGPHDEATARRIHAVITETWPDESPENRDRYRHALVATVTGRRDTGPVWSSSELTAREQHKVLALLDQIGLGEAQLLDPGETVEVITGHDRWAAVSLDADPLSVEYGRGEASEGVVSGTTKASGPPSPVADPWDGSVPDD